MTEDQRMLIAELNRNPAFAELKRWMQEQRDGYLRNLAKTIVANPDAVTPTAIREKAAFFRGMNTIFNQPFISATQLSRVIEADSEVTE